MESKSTLIIETFNILHDNKLIYKPILQSSYRFAQTVDSILESESDVYCLNEVDPSFLRLLDRSSVYQKYPFREKSEDGRRGHSVMILSKFKLTLISKCQSMVISQIRCFRKPITIAAVHLTAYQDRAEKRRQELKSIRAVLQNSSNYKNDEDCRNLIVLGDLNLHLLQENLLLHQNGYIDCWMQCHPQDPGYTWDPQENSLINKFVPFDNRRMRLDRIAVSGSSNLNIKDITITHKERIPGSFYLQKSDHFGLKARLEFHPNIVFEYDHKEQLKKYQNKSYTGFRSMRQIVYLRILAVVVLILGFILVYYLGRIVGKLIT